MGLESAALACTSATEEMKIALSDAVIDGVAACDMQRGRCRLRATELIKEDARRRTDSDFYILRFQPGANEKLTRAMAKAGEIWMCVWPWEPERPVVEGRFYLMRAGTSYRPRQDSARGYSRLEEVAE
jgi:hypothetical protein